MSNICPKCCNDTLEVGYGLAGGGIGAYAYCTTMGCDHFDKTQEHPHCPAAFINAIADEGSKQEAVRWLQKTWNEACWLRAIATRLQGEVERLQSDVRFMVERAANEKLDGYWELGAKCASLEERAEEAERRAEAHKADAEAGSKVIAAARRLVIQTNYIRNMDNANPHKGTGNHLADALDAYDATPKGER